MAKCVLAALKDSSEKGNAIYSFENFMTFEGNMIAHNAAKSIAYGSTNAYNPLFIYGGPGTGKTHLLKAIEETISANEEKKAFCMLQLKNLKMML